MSVVMYSVPSLCMGKSIYNPVISCPTHHPPPTLPTLRSSYLFPQQRSIGFVFLCQVLLGQLHEGRSQLRILCT